MSVTFWTYVTSMPEVPQVSNQDIEGEECKGMSGVRRVIRGNSADVNPNVIVANCPAAQLVASASYRGSSDSCLQTVPDVNPPRRRVPCPLVRMCRREYTGAAIAACGLLGTRRL